MGDEEQSTVWIIEYKLFNTDSEPTELGADGRVVETPRTTTSLSQFAEVMGADEQAARKAFSATGADAHIVRIKQKA